MRKYQIFLGVIIVVLAAFHLTRKNSQKSLDVSYGTVTDFSLTDSEGKPFGLSDLRGHPWVADFIFTRCQGPCPLLTFRMSELQKEFSSKPNLKFVSFTVDPGHDTPPVLRIYAKNNGADPKRWHFLTGKKEAIYKTIRESFKLAVEPAAPSTSAAADFIHSLHFVLVGPDGTIRGYFNTMEEGALDRLRKELKQLS